MERQGADTRPYERYERYDGEGDAGCVGAGDRSEYLYSAMDHKTAKKYEKNHGKIWRWGFLRQGSRKGER